MRARGLSPDSRSCEILYHDLIDLFVQDIRDPVDVPGSLKLDTLMTGEEQSASLAKVLLASTRS
jgi:LPPG:FO 2-phospho-L-lactate transferase